MSITSISSALNPTMDPATGKADPAMQKKIMTLTGVHVLILMVMMSLIALALELLAILRYPDALKKKSDATQEDLSVVDLLRDLDTTLRAHNHGFHLVDRATRFGWRERDCLDNEFDQ